MQFWLRILASMMAVGTALAPSVAASEGRIEWSVVNSFRFFTDVRDTGRHAEALKWLTDEERRQPVLNVERKLARRFALGWAAEMHGPTCWDQRRNRHRCPGNKGYINPVAHKVEMRVAAAGLDFAERCDWQVEARRIERRGRLGKKRIQSFTKPCREAVEIAVPYRTGAKVIVRARGDVIAREAIKVRDLFIVGMGDSFGSGEGNPDMPVRFASDRVASYGKLSSGVVFEGYPARVGGWSKLGDERFRRSGAKWLDQACHRSLYSHQLRAALQLALEDPHRAVTFAGVACSGAEIIDGLFLRYKGNEWVESPPDLAQISAVAQAQCGWRPAPAKDLPEAYHVDGKIPKLQGGLVLRECPRDRARRIDLLFVSVGGNDIGFARLVANAVLSDRTMLRRLGGWFGQVVGPGDAVEPLRNLRARYKALNRALHYILHIPWNENDRVVLAAYPGMALLHDGRVCESGRLGMDVLPQYRLNPKRALAAEKVAGQLYRAMAREARRNGWRLADAHRKQFLGRGICAGQTGPRAADDLRLPRKRRGFWEPYDPAGYRPYAQRLRWFRTPNDAFLTGNLHVKQAVLRRVLRSKRLQWTQLLLASTYSGAFHPTAEGQAAMADAVVREARKTLKRLER